MAILQSVNSGRPLRRIGIPRALLYYKYGVLWERFFAELGYDVLLSGETTKAVLDAGDSHSIDEACLASKVYMGHVAELVDRVDALFIPSFASTHAKCGFCTKFQALPDMVDNTFRHEKLDIVSLSIDDVTNERKTRSAYVDMAMNLGAPLSQAKSAYKKAAAAQASHDAALAKHVTETVSLMEQYRKVANGDPLGQEQAPPLLLVVAHPYIAHDPYVFDAIAEAIESTGAMLLYADEADHAKALKRSFDFSETLPWLVNRELAGATLSLKDTVDGVISVSAFPCGPDSMFCDALMRRVENVPMLHLTLDAQSGSAGIQTRIESFVDILRFKQEGGYFHA